MTVYLITKRNVLYHETEGERHACMVRSHVVSLADSLNSFSPPCRKEKMVQYQSGFGNEFATEALEGALPKGKEGLGLGIG